MGSKLVIRRGSEDMVLRLRAQATLPGDQGSISATIIWLTYIYNSDSRGSNVGFWPPQVPAHIWHTDIHTGKTLIHTK